MRPARRRVAVVTVARSDYGHLRPLLAELQGSPAIELLLVVAGSHLADRYGRTERLVEADGWPIAARVPMLEDDDAPAAVARSIGRGVAGFADCLAALCPDLLVVLGDRFEMMSAALAALPLTIPVAHIHGGEVTEAAIDEQLRHAITKLSHLHFASAEPYAARLRQMGEEPWRVHCTGAPGLDRFRRTPFLPREELQQRLGLPLRRPTLLVTFHPVSLEHEATAHHVDELLAALAEVEATMVVTYPGADPGSRTIITRLETFVAGRPRARLVRSLGDDVYASLLREADAMVGNSSSGLIEAPTFGLPVLNIGDRQRGRLRAANVVDVGHDRRDIAAGLARVLDPAFAAGLRGMANPYGDGRAAPRITRVLRDAELGARLLTKRFVDRPAREA